MAVRGEDRSFSVLGVDDPVAAVERIISSRCGPRVRCALIYALEGAGYREAARLAGLGDHKGVYRAARRLDLTPLHDERKELRDSVRYSKRDLAAVEAVLRGPGNASTSQLVRAYAASMKRVRP